MHFNLFLAGILSCIASVSSTTLSTFSTTATSAPTAPGSASPTGTQSAESLPGARDHSTGIVLRTRIAAERSSRLWNRIYGLSHDILDSIDSQIIDINEWARAGLLSAEQHIEASHKMQTDTALAFEYEAEAASYVNDAQYCSNAAHETLDATIEAIERGDVPGAWRAAEAGLSWMTEAESMVTNAEAVWGQIQEMARGIGIATDAQASNAAA